jgi:hypothetical protein
MITTIFEIGDTCFMKNDRHRKTPLLVTEISEVRPMTHFNYITGEHETDDFEPYQQLTLSWLNSQKTLCATKLRTEAVTKEE